MSSLPVLNQEYSDLCYAYSGVQLVDAWRFSHGDTRRDHRTSAVAAGVHYAIGFEERTHNRLAAMTEGGAIVGGGNIYQLMDQLRLHGSCSNSRIDTVSAMGVYNPKDGYPDPYRRFMSAMSQTDLSPEFNQLWRSFELSDSRFCTNYINPKVEQEFVNFVYAFLREMTGAEIAVRDVCRDHTITLDNLPAMTGFTNTQARNDSRGFVNSYTQTLNERLNRDNAQPVAVSYCLDLLQNKDFRKFQSNGSNGDACAIGRHLSVIVGQRQVNGRCQFLLRNSFGTDCSDDRLDPRWGSDCQNGQFWIDSEALARNADELSWLDSN
jgi:hypothetical protein